MSEEEKDLGLLVDYMMMTMGHKSDEPVKINAILGHAKG